MSHHRHQAENEKAQLRNDVLDGFEQFLFLVDVHARRQALTAAINQSLRERPRRPINDILRETDPTQFAAATELSVVLQKLHGTVVGFNELELGEIDHKVDITEEGVSVRTVRGEPLRNPCTVLVRGHKIDVALLGCWTVMLDIVDAPASIEDELRPGQWLYPLELMHDFEVLQLNNVPVDDI